MTRPPTVQRWPKVQINSLPNCAKNLKTLSGGQHLSVYGLVGPWEAAVSV